jgi:hypothetical protein
LLKQVTALKKNFKSGVAPESAAPLAVSEPPPPSYSTAAPQKKKQPVDEIKLLLDRWKAVIDHMGKVDSLARRYFIDTAPLRTDATHLVVGFDPEFASEQERFDNPRLKIVLAREVEKYLGRRVEVRFEPLPAGVSKVLPADHVVPQKSTEAELTGMQKWYAKPVVKTVVEAFNGEISDIRE